MGNSVFRRPPYYTDGVLFHLKAYAFVQSPNGKPAYWDSNKNLEMPFFSLSTAPHKWEIFMGEDKDENDLLIRYGMPEDIWCVGEDEFIGSTLNHSFRP